VLNCEEECENRVRIVSAPFRHDRLTVTVTVTGKGGIL